MMWIRGEGLKQHRLWSGLALLIASRLGAQGEVIPSSSEMYHRLEAVSAFFPARGVFLGDRGASRRQFLSYVERLRVAVTAAPASARKDWARRELSDVIAYALRAPAGTDTSAPPSTWRASWRAHVSGSDAATERVPNNGLGVLDAVTNPFDAGRDGRRLERGASAAFAPTFAAVGDRFVAVLEPRFSSYVSPGGTERIWQGSVHRAYARGVVRNVSLRLGATEMRWGQSSLGALFISGNAAPFPAIELATDTAITLPWLLRLAGPVRGSLIVADLGDTQDPPHTKLAGWLVSVMPWSRFELGVSVLLQTGGSGGPKATFFERVVDLFPVIDALAPQHADLLISNKLAGGNLRLRIPELSGLDLYYELQIDDFDGRRLRSSLVDDAAHLVGARVPFLTSLGLVAVRGEWHNTALRLYEHTQFRSGFTYRQKFIGSPLGPHAAAGYLSALWQPSQVSTLELTFADERRDPGLYTATSGQRDRDFRFIRVTDDPDYRRARALLSVERALSSVTLRALLGHNVAWRTGQPKRREWLGQVTLSSVHLPTF